MHTSHDPELAPRPIPLHAMTPENRAATVSGASGHKARISLASGVSYCVEITEDQAHEMAAIAGQGAVQRHYHGMGAYTLVFGVHHD